MVDIQQILTDINNVITADFAEQTSAHGKVANYIPELAKVAPEQFAVAVYTNQGELFSAGDANTAFSIQSISKVLTLALSLQRYGDDLWQYVGKEPSGTAFNSLTQLELEQGIPRNPFINAGAIRVCDALQSRTSAPLLTYLESLRALAGNQAIKVNKAVARSEYQHRFRNAAMAYLMKSFGNFNNSVEAVLANYCKYCAVEMSVADLAKAFSFLAHKGISPITGERFISAKQNSQLNSLLFTSGLYDAAGDFAYRIGMPGKSGVGGGIIAVVPGSYTIAVFSPRLNQYGNSVAGLKALEMFTKQLDIQLF